MRSNSDAAGPAAIRGSGWFGTFRVWPGRGDLLEGLDAGAERSQLVGVDDLAHARELWPSSSAMWWRISGISVASSASKAGSSASSFSSVCSIS